VIAEADVILAVGTELAETDLFYAYKLPLGGLLVRIDIDQNKLADQYGADVRIWADAKSALKALNAALAAPRPAAAGGSTGQARKGFATSRGGAAAFRAALAKSFDAKTRTMDAALRAVRAAMPWDGVVFSDMTQIAYFGNYAYPVEHPGQWFHPAGYGTLGYALPAALGGKLSTPSRAVIALAGDFGLQFTLNELMTAVEAKVSLPIVLWNNGALGQIRDDMVGAGIPPTGVVGENPDFCALAKAYGAHAVRVRDAHALSTALRTALDAGKPTLIEIIAESFA
jgi:thiamine pyrophosphate-dependent acetolactate synthase large subunit-like protein